MASEQLLKTLENMSNDDFETFKWFLEKPVVEDCKPIPKCHLEDAKRTKIVTKMIESYGDNLAVKVAIEVLRKQRLNDVAEKLKKAYEEKVMPSSSSSTSVTSSSSSGVTPPPAAATVSAQGGSMIIAPTLNSGTTGSWNINIHKS